MYIEPPHIKMLENVQNTRPKSIEGRKRELLSTLLTAREKEFKLILDEDKTSIKITTQKGKTIELKPTKNGNLKIYTQNQHQTTILKKELINKITKKLENKIGEKTKIGCCKSSENNRNVLAILLKLKASLRQYEINQGSIIEPNH